MLEAIVGINWGDEGKGRMVDLLSDRFDVVVRYQGGNNAGHTVINEKGKFILNLLPSGILRDDVVNVMGNGMVVDLRHLAGEVSRLREGGISVSPENLKISDRAVVCMPYHVQLDCLEEERLKDKKFGSTKRGIGPVYGDKYMKKVLKMGDLLHKDTLLEKVKDLVEWKNLVVEKGYGAAPITVESVMEYLETYGTPFLPYIADCGAYLNQAALAGKNIMFEAQLGALRDIDFGIFPYTSSSSTIAAYAPVGAGIPNLKLDNVVGIMKAYSTCVGEGPFVCEYFGEKAEKLREAGGEYGAATGRPRRVGPFDVVASRYGVRMQGADEIALTKLDVLSGFDTLEITTAYELDGKEVTEFPYTDALYRCKPVNVTVPGWHCDISKARKAEDLPKEALDYIHTIEKLTGCFIRYVSVGAEREAYIDMEDSVRF